MEDLESIEGVGPTTASKLRAAGFVTVEVIAATPPTEISEKTGIGLGNVLKIQEAARKILSADFKTAARHQGNCRRESSKAKIRFWRRPLILFNNHKLYGLINRWFVAGIKSECR